MKLKIPRHLDSGKSSSGNRGYLKGVSTSNRTQQHLCKNPGAEWSLGVREKKTLKGQRNQLVTRLWSIQQGLVSCLLSVKMCKVDKHCEEDIVNRE